VVSQPARRNPQSPWHGQILRTAASAVKDTRPLRISLDRFGGGDEGEEAED
jgi:hypothetical protein